MIDTAPPATKSPSAANSDHTYASRPCPSGCAWSGGRVDRRLATTRKISLPVSAQEWAVSAASDADPVITAAIDFATATRRLAPSAINTVSVLSESASRTGQAAPSPDSPGPRPTDIGAGPRARSRSSGAMRLVTSLIRPWPPLHRRDMYPTRAACSFDTTLAQVGLGERSQVPCDDAGGAGTGSTARGIGGIGDVGGC